MTSWFGRVSWWLPITRSWGSIWLMRSRRWCSPIMIRGCWPAAVLRPRRGSWARCWRGRASRPTGTASPMGRSAANRRGIGGGCWISSPANRIWRWYVCSRCWSDGPASPKDYTRDKTDDKDAVLIARLVAQLHCYAPERADETWARLRQLGSYRDRLITQATAGVQQLRDLLECAWPAVLAAAAQPFESTNWCAALAVGFDRCNGHPQGLAPPCAPWVFS